MISLTVDNNEISIKGEGNSVLVYTEELLAIGFIRNILAEQFNMTTETANEMIIAALHEKE